MDDRITIPGNWLLDPLLRGRHMGHWVSIKRVFSSDHAEFAIQESFRTGKDPITMDPWWVGHPVMVEDYETYRKLYESMDDPTREKTADDLEQHIGLVRVPAPKR
jgi:hypothetical protein